MAKPWIHSLNSVKKFGGKPEDYIDIHNFMDSSKSAFPDNRHRALTHNSWFLFVLERVFGVIIINSDQRQISVRDVGEQHILEDFGMRFIPSPQDYLENMEIVPWMNTGIGYPSSAKKIEKKIEPMTEEKRKELEEYLINAKDNHIGKTSNTSKPYLDGRISKRLLD